jgi:hypothetical protein
MRPYFSPDDADLPGAAYWIAGAALAAALVFAQSLVLSEQEEDRNAAIAHDAMARVAKAEHALSACLNGKSLQASDGSIIGCREAETVAIDQKGIIQ